MKRSLTDRIRAAGVTQQKIGDACGLTQSRVSKMLRDGVRDIHVATVSNLTGIPKSEIRPDLFGDIE